jgi:hypothetical protein
MSEKQSRSPRLKPHDPQPVSPEEHIALKAIVLALVAACADQHARAGGKAKDFVNQLAAAASQAILAGSVRPSKRGGSESLNGEAANTVPKMLKMVSKIRAI